MSIKFEIVGRSREERPIEGVRIGKGALNASIVAGAHADESIGPRTARRFAHFLASDTPQAAELCERFTFHILPDVNPDGAERNAAWSETLDAVEYLRHAHREPPGEDVEFCYPRAPDDREARPENLAVADFLRAVGGSFAFHASLHGMAMAEGAWFLVCQEWAERVRQSGMTERLANAAGRHGLGLHDLDRQGEKGFTRIAPGFSTTPHADAMREHFLARGDAETAGLFRPSSMDFVQSLGGDPLCIVSEIPLFTISRPDPEGPGAAYERVRELLPQWRQMALEGRDEAVRAAMREHAIEPVSEANHSALQENFVMEGLRLVWEAARSG